MNIKYWLIIRDDSKRTFEVCGRESNDNAFTNRTHAMQKAGMNVTCMTPPVSGKTSSKELIKYDGYTREDGLQDRLMKQFLEITLRNSHDEWDEELEN
ncbi:MAG: hypothetical protein KBF45_04985 [Cyclobacteriaceae bacterium]|jgi:hypothetical protein|nr:hypothetical protein [Cyclobacteriaceae bacterium]